MNKQKQKSLLESEKARFVFVGGINTAVDFSVLFSLTVLLGVPVFLANIVSTSFALCISYILNKKAVFKNSDATRAGQVVLFVSVTLVGLWVLQGIVIWLVSISLQPFQFDQGLVLFAGKCMATLFSLIWNYIWYSRVIFRQQNHREK